MLLRFERAVNKNQEQRSKYPDDPSKCDPSNSHSDSFVHPVFLEDL